MCSFLRAASIACLVFAPVAIADGGGNSELQRISELPHGLRVGLSIEQAAAVMATGFQLTFSDGELRTYTGDFLGHSASSIRLHFTGGRLAFVVADYRNLSFDQLLSEMELQFGRAVSPKTNGPKHSWIHLAPGYVMHIFEEDGSVGVSLTSGYLTSSVFRAKSKAKSR